MSTLFRVELKSATANGSILLLSILQTDSTSILATSINWDLFGEGKFFGSPFNSRFSEFHH